MVMKDATPLTLFLNVNNKLSMIPEDQKNIHSEVVRGYNLKPAHKH